MLSHALVAYTIEFDNEFEHRMPHRTAATTGSPPGSSDAPWLTSMAMWSTCVRFLDDDGLTVGELECRARTGTNLDGLRRWGYVTIDGRGRRGGAQRVGRDAVLRLTEAGRRAARVWTPLSGEIEARWRERFGPGNFDRLERSLRALACVLDPALPDCMPILGHGMFIRDRVVQREEEPLNPSAPDLPGLLSRTLVAFAVEFEQTSRISYAIATDVLAALDAELVAVRDLPSRNGVSKEAVAMALRYLVSRGLVTESKDEAPPRVRRVSLTQAGVHARADVDALRASTEARWEAAFGQGLVRDVRAGLGAVLDQREVFWRGLEPYPDGWRASLWPPATLPDFPMVLHRGGYPDGS
jgi:DNA-binding MarR family transcriptional regulator